MLIDDTVLLFFTNKEPEEFEDILNGVKVKSTAGAYGREVFDIHAKGLKISTIKSFKGLEMENVILVLNENRRGRMTKETIKEEVYVGLTRATRKLIILDGLAYDYLRSIYM